MLDNLKQTTFKFKVISDVSKYLVNLDKEEKIDLQKIAPGEFKTICEIVLEKPEFANPTDLNKLIKMTMGVIQP